MVLSAGVKLDFGQFPDGYVVRAADIEAELARTDHVLQPLEIVMVNTAAGARYGPADYVASGCGMSREASAYLVARSIGCIRQLGPVRDCSRRRASLT